MMVENEDYQQWYIHDDESDGFIKNGKFVNLYWHRVGGPARIKKLTGAITFWVDNHRIYDVRTYCEMCNFSDEQTVIWVLKYGEFLPKHIDQF